MADHSEDAAHGAEASVLLRPEVMACQRTADDLRGQADDAFAAAEFWASLCATCCDGSAECDNPLCYESWRNYPDG